MDARMCFEWSNDKAKNLVTAIHKAGFFGPGFEDIVEREDADYEISLSVKLKHKRIRKKKGSGNE